MKNRTLEYNAKQQTLSDLEKQVIDLRDKMDNVKNDIFELNSERLHYLRSWHNGRIDKDVSLEYFIAPINTNYLPDYSYTVKVVKELLHRQTLNNERYRTERKLYNNICNYINNNSFEFVTPSSVKRLIEKYKTQNAKHLIKKLDLERKLQARKQNLTALIVGNRGTRYWERKSMTDYERAEYWFNDTMQKFVKTTVEKFKKLISDNAGNEEYPFIRFERYASDVKKWYEAITKTHTMTLGQLKAIVYKQVKECYRFNLKRHNAKQCNTIKEKALQKHKLTTMTPKQRKKLQFEKWSKVKNTIAMFSGAIEIDKKITFDNYKPVPTEESVKQIINDCGLVETHVTLSDGTTRVELYV